VLERALIILVLALTQTGCDINYGENLYPLELWNLEEVRSGLEREKREFLKIEDLQVGDGAIASWGRRLKAEIEVRYANDGTTIYKGPIVTYFGFHGLISSDLGDRFMLNFGDQDGIQLGFTMVWLSVVNAASRSAPNWSVEGMLPAAICSDPNVSSSTKLAFTKRPWLSRPL